jgi:hypothetical protein
MDPAFDDAETQRMPPSEVRFLDVHVEPWPDGRRVRVHLALTPFEQKPNIHLEITNSAGEPVASTAIVESMIHKIVITMHLRSLDPAGLYHLEAITSYPDLDQPVDRSALDFTSLPHAPAEG